ncbi:hypothetical protein E2562_012046 [Oryza meyeriana var. granulata]|uniref:Uncharacterized protein n=1 Tax=Oryza meyeriana var. granulata TaxID=110450 RepID=A0A6G1D4F1_9ORYZ|nr:hypothetical protein E2562_012046 [Oryza meyeriana var. granulata]
MVSSLPGRVRLSMLAWVLSKESMKLYCVEIGIVLAIRQGLDTHHACQQVVGAWVGQVQVPMYCTQGCIALGDQ